MKSNFTGLLLCWGAFLCKGEIGAAANAATRTEHAGKLYESLLTGYNKMVRPVQNTSEVVRVKLKLRLVQLLDVHEKNQIMTTNVWLKQEWVDDHFQWNPADYGGVEFLHFSADDIWLPGVVLYNNADGQYQVAMVTKVTVYYNGTTSWEPPAVFHSMCPINIRWFPFDEQDCELRFGSWTYAGDEVDLVHYDSRNALETLEKGQKKTKVQNGIDISRTSPSAEWDIMEIPSERNEVRFICCDSPYVDITFSLNLRRKTLYYTVNLMIPCAGISLLTVVVFHLPSDSGEKVGLCINILICLTWFFLLLVEIIPGTSLVIPLIGLYILFNMVIVTLSIIVSVVTLNVHYRSPNSHRLPKWARSFFTRWLPKVPPAPPAPLSSEGSICGKGSAKSTGSAVTDLVDTVTGGVDDTQYIAEHFNLQTYDGDIKEDWRYIAQVLDRLFLWLFCLMTLIGTCLIILRAPVIYDRRVPLV